MGHFIVSTKWHSRSHFANKDLNPEELCESFSASGTMKREMLHAELRWVQIELRHECSRAVRSRSEAESPVPCSNVTKLRRRSFLLKESRTGHSTALSGMARPSSLCEQGSEPRGTLRELPRLRDDEAGNFSRRASSVKKFSRGCQGE
jgi:hypothetical protein